MEKIIFTAPKKGGKTQMLLSTIQNEYAKGIKCYYLGGKKHFENIINKLTQLECKAQIEFITKDTVILDNSAIFTDDLTWEMTNIFPYTIRTMTKLKGKWYCTIPAEFLIFLQTE